jgi:hypothetical protein
VVWTGLIWLRIGTSGGILFEHDKAVSGTIKYWEILS